MARNPFVRNINEIESVSTSHGAKFASSRKRLSGPCGGVEIGASWYEIPPGKRAFPHHMHFGNEEAFFILSGSGVARVGKDRVPVSVGDYIACPAANEDCTHSIENTGTEPLRYLGISTANSTDICVYPDSGKFACIGGADVNKGLRQAKFLKMMKLDVTQADYFEGEE